jgi:hypothetical protein
LVIGNALNLFYIEICLKCNVQYFSIGIGMGSTC